MIELMTTIVCLVIAGFLLFPKKKEIQRTREHNTTGMAEDANNITRSIRSCVNEEQLETARRLVECFKDWHGETYQGAKDYDALCVIYNQQKEKLKRTRRYSTEGDLTSEYLNLKEIPTIPKYGNRKN